MENQERHEQFGVLCLELALRYGFIKSSLWVHKVEQKSHSYLCLGFFYWVNPQAKNMKEL